MPIYEFKCLKCGEFFESLIMGNDDEMIMQCPKCKAEDFERVLSSSNYAMGDGNAPNRVSSQTRHCSTGNCTTYTLPGHTE
ncbi:FmdB family transcriptional regulator [Candidatus Magnetomoraceae bacterium gMMP-15]